MSAYPITPPPVGAARRSGRISQASADRARAPPVPPPLPQPVAPRRSQPSQASVPAANEERNNLREHAQAEPGQQGEYDYEEDELAFDEAEAPLAPEHCGRSPSSARSGSRSVADELADLQAALEASEAKRKALENRCKGLSIRVGKLTEEKAESKERAQEASLAAMAATDKNTVLEKYTATLEKRLTAAEKKVKDVAEVESSYEQTLANAKSAHHERCRRINAKVTALEADKKVVIDANAHLNRRVVDLRTELAAAKTQAQTQAHRRVHALQATKSSSQNASEPSQPPPRPADYFADIDDDALLAACGSF